MQTAKVFQNGRGQAIRFPKYLRVVSAEMHLQMTIAIGSTESGLSRAPSTLPKEEEQQSKALVTPARRFVSTTA